MVAVTRGTLEKLNRAELQGVVAHEFSHIVNGDMRLNIRLIGILFGILMVALVGRLLFRWGALAGSRSNRDSGGGVPLLVLGIGLLILGYVGVFFGNLIKASVSRQREYLADASAVQFTREPSGIAGALKKIGGDVQGSLITHPDAEELSHAYFSEGVHHMFSSLFATHPPLEQRIRRIEPGWDGQFIVPRPVSAVEVEKEEEKLHPGIRCPPWRAKRRRVVPGSREATRDTRRAEGAKGDPKGASERGVQSYGRPVCSRNELAMLWRNAG